MNKTKIGMLFALQSKARSLSPDNNRLTACYRYRVPGASVINVHRANEGRKAWFSNLMRCGAVWSCPVCSVKICDVRGMELRQAIEKHEAGGGKTAMLTYTLKHDASEPLTTTFSALREAMRAERASRGGGVIRELVFAKHSFTAIEITHGASGWHPHAHQVWFMHKDAYTGDIQQKMEKSWIAHLEKLGRTGKKGVALTVSYPSIAAGVYLGDISPAKGSAAKSAIEVTGGERSKASRTGLDVLADTILKEGSSDGLAAAFLWLEYVSATFGKNRMTKSLGFDTAFKIKQKTDTQAGETEIDAGHVWAEIGWEVWRAINSQGRDVRASLLAAAANNDSMLFEEIVESALEGESIDNFA